MVQFQVAWPGNLLIMTKDFLLILLFFYGLSLFSFKFESSYSFFRILFGFQYYDLCFFSRVFSSFSIIFCFFGLKCAFFSISISFSIRLNIWICCNVLLLFFSTLASLAWVSAILLSLPNWGVLMFFFRTSLSTVLSRNDSHIIIKIYSHFSIFTTKR